MKTVVECRPERITCRLYVLEHGANLDHSAIERWYYYFQSRANRYLSDCVQTVSRSSSRSGLRSSDTAAYVKPRCRTRLGERGFSYTGPTAWNSLPAHLNQISDTSICTVHAVKFLGVMVQQDGRSCEVCVITVCTAYVCSEVTQTSGDATG